MAPKALPAVVFGVIIVSGEVGEPRIPLLRRILRCPPDLSASAFRVWLLKQDDPFYHTPLVLATNAALEAESVYLIYRDRWPVEQPPLASTQMVGLHRQFVFAPETCFRLPELALLAGSILTYIAVVLLPIPTGFWDRTPKATPGRLRRHLALADFPNVTEIDPQLRKKHSVTSHLSAFKTGKIE